MPDQSRRKFRRFRFKVHEIIFESDTPAGKLFDIILLAVIAISVVVVMLESIDSIRLRWGFELRVLEWVFTVFFTLEYILRLYSVYKSWKYASSFYGVIDFLALLPTYLGIFITGGQSLIVIRSLRLLRIFRILKLGSFMTQGAIILDSINQSKKKIAVFLYFIVLLVLIIGSVMYVVEGEDNPAFDSIPTSIYWAIVTLTTVGYGDIIPITNIGKFLSAVVMILGYAVIAVPTGIVSASLIRADAKVTGQCCPTCSKEGHEPDAVYCKYCGEILNPDPEDF